MHLLADENIESETVHWLRQDGHDVLWVAESMGGATDAEIINTAESEQRILLTHDLDFGEHVVRQQRCRAGVILLRLPMSPTTERLDLMRRQWPEVESRAEGHLVVITAGAIRVRPLTMEQGDS